MYKYLRRRAVSGVEILSELRKIRGKFRKDEGIYVFGRATLLGFNEYMVSTSPVYTDVFDLSPYRQKIIFYINNEDADVLVQPETSFTGSGPWVPMREEVTVSAGNAKFSVLNDYHPYVRFKLTAGSAPSHGYFYVAVFGIT